MKFADTHAHLHFPHFEEDRDQLIKLFPSKGVEFVINVGIDVEDSKKAVELAKKYERIYCSVGVHPHEAGKVKPDYLEKLEELTKEKKVVAIGETGLDYYRNFSSKEDQTKVFKEQLLLAKELDLPVIIHIRDAYEDAYKILSEIGLPTKGGVVHAFSADSDWALKFVQLGLFIGIGGPVTYPKNLSLKSVVRAVGIENILTETDCPYLPPQQLRGKRNEPSYIRLVLEEIAKILDEDVEQVAQITLANAKELFLS
ncbi:TatD family hydrolase [Pseudothermotoga thermarum]|uniref:Hydrolase, TatD family n=1 Tax=Pseudothermotoga thermarum DSM 5069 TaxID=688269 RepID=F7YX72_9THEM|nr:TatD family hydrolase [Pseudothermotoga thermarum]AEH51100.1 hydrolase, TatD family [Pseudothermotoga thermarum DSM 5069]